MKKAPKHFNTSEPMLDAVRAKFTSAINFNDHPFCVPVIKNLEEITFPTAVTFLVGENGSGKSTLLEAIALNAGFGPEGGSRNINFKTSLESTYTGIQHLSSHVTLSWRRKPKNGYFFRAESFFNVANYIDALALQDALAYQSYGNKSLHAQSHGESFLSFFNNRLGNGGFFIFDEPEAALSPQRQLSLLVIMHDMCKNFDAQFIIATHSPLLLAYPQSTIYSCDEQIIKPIAYKDTQHYQITKRFLDDPDYYLQHLFSQS